MNFSSILYNRTLLSDLSHGDKILKCLDLKWNVQYLSWYYLKDNFIYFQMV